MILKCDLNKKNTLIEKESWHRVKFKESIDMELQIIGYSVYFPKKELKKFPGMFLGQWNLPVFFAKGKQPPLSFPSGCAVILRKCA